VKRLAIAGLLAAGAAPAQDLIPQPAPQDRPIYLFDAVVHTVSGATHERGGLLLRDGKIERVFDGPASELPSDVRRIDAEGKHAYPGLISAWTSLGLTEVESLPETIDVDEVGDVNPEVRAAVAVNPDSTAIPVTRINGVLAAGVVPRGGLLPGYASAVALAGWTWEEMTLRDRAGLVLAWPGAGDGGRRRRQPDPTAEGPEAQRRAVQQLEAAFAEARAYLRAREADPTLPTDIRKEALRPVLEREAPVFVLASKLDDIVAAVGWCADQGVRAVLVGGRDAPACIDLLKRNDVAVILLGTHRLPDRRDADYDEPFRLPASLEAAGLRWCLATDGGFANERNLPYHAGTAIAHGLPREVALRSITLSAAEILGVADRLGSLEAGKDATLFLADGPPWELTTKVTQAFIAGREVPLRSKHTDLDEKYRAKYRQRGLIK
jgi:imidazolonepropionase-like amidohydrolase